MDGFATCTALPQPFNRSMDDRPPPAAWHWDTPAVTECRMRRVQPRHDPPDLPVSPSPPETDRASVGVRVQQPLEGERRS
jgi:hypothetical protein